MEFALDQDIDGGLGTPCLLPPLTRIPNSIHFLLSSFISTSTLRLPLVLAHQSALPSRGDLAPLTEAQMTPVTP